ncbi:MAG: DUF4010 domain-containing protein [Calothrix sp. SM1_5_4]|nr:DUF4010 domain-containing protein [Calothrix sp. SM1_5_4]
MTGLFELHGISVAMTTMFTREQLPFTTAFFAILLATMASLIAKIFMLWIAHRGAFSRFMTMAFLLMMIALGLGAWLRPEFWSG